MKKLLRWLTRIGLLLLFMITTYLLFAVILSYTPTRPPEYSCSETRQAYVSTNGIHLYVIIPADLLDTPFRNDLHLLPGTRYISFGWGDKEFYTTTPTWKDLTFKTAFNALFLNDDAAAHVTHYKRSYDSWRSIALCPEQFTKLHTYIGQTFDRDTGSAFIPVQTVGYGSTDFFFEAKGSYSLFKTSNVWVNKALKAADVRTSVWSPFDFGVLHFIPDPEKKIRK